MTDFIQEVDEDLRRERYKVLWEKYGKFVVAGMVVLVVAIAGSVAYRDWRQSKRAEDTRKLVEAVELSATDPKLGPDALASLAKSSSSGVSTLARLHQAAAFGRAGDAPKAIEIYDQVAADSSVDAIFRDLAVLMAAQYRADGPEAGAAALKLIPLIQETNPWHHPALELTAVIALGQGDKARARDIFRRLADDATASPAIRGRAAEMVAALAD